MHYSQVEEAAAAAPSADAVVTFSMEKGRREDFWQISKLISAHGNRGRLLQSFFMSWMLPYQLALSTPRTSLTKVKIPIPETRGDRSFHLFSYVTLLVHTSSIYFYFLLNQLTFRVTRDILAFSCGRFPGNLELCRHAFRVTLYIVDIYRKFFNNIKLLKKDTQHTRPPRYAAHS